MPYPDPLARPGFNRMELLVILAVLAALIGLLLPAVQKMREADARLKCQEHLRKISQAAHEFHDSRGKFPAGETVMGSFLGPWEDELYTSWVFPLLPYLGEEHRARELARVTGFSQRHRGGPASLYGTPIPVLICPSDLLPRKGTFEYRSAASGHATYRKDFPEGRYDAVCSYGANWGTQIFLNSPSQELDKNGVFHYNTRTRLVDITDGTAHTILFGERSHREPRWKFMGYTYPAQQNFAVYSRWYTGGVFTGRQPHEMINYRLPSWIQKDPPPMGSPTWNDLYYKRLGCYGSEHPGGCNLVMTDGSVRFVAQTLTLTTLQALATKAGEEVILAE